MDWSGLKPLIPRRSLVGISVLASALLSLGGPVAAAASLGTASAGPALHVQFRQDQDGRYPQGGYGQDQYRPDPYRPDQSREDQRRYGDPRDGDGQDRPGPGSRRYDDQRDRYRQQGGREGGGREGGGRGGSYQQSCRDIRQDGSTVSAVCDDGRGRRVETSIDANRCGRSDIGNNRGYLQCGNVRGAGRPVD